MDENSKIDSIRCWNKAEGSSLIRQKDTMNLKKYLEQQMNEKLKVNAFQNFENKKPHNTYYGPKEKGLILANHINNTVDQDTNKIPRQKVMSKELSNHLKKQMNEKRRVENAQKYKDRLEDAENLWVAGKVLEKERLEKIEKDKVTITFKP